MDTNFMAYLANSRKAILNLLTAVFTVGTYILTTNTLSGKYVGFLTTLVGAVGLAIHYFTPNAPAPGAAVADESVALDEDEGDEDLPTFTDDELVTTEHDEGALATLSVAQALGDEPVSVGKHEAV